MRGPLKEDLGFEAPRGSHWPRLRWDLYLLLAPLIGYMNRWTWRSGISLGAYCPRFGQFSCCKDAVDMYALMPPCPGSCTSRGILCTACSQRPQ